MRSPAAILVQLGAPLEIWDLELPLLLPGQVLVEMAYSGFCHSQLNEMRGLKGEDRFLPHTLGHEGAGRVLEIGSEVTKVRPGDHVVVSWIKGRGRDVPGCQYLSERGRVNSGAVSTFLKQTILSENRVIPIPPEMPLREAALLGCAIPTGAGVVNREMDLKEGDSFVVFGVGGVGLSALLAAKMAKAYPRIAVDIHEDKLQKAKMLGATHLVNGSVQDPVEAIREITGGRGASFVFESAGRREAMERGFASLKVGGLCVLAGNLPKGEKISIDPFDLILGKRLVGTWGGKSQIDEDVLSYTESYLKKGMPLADLITHEISLEEINTLPQLLERGVVGRALIKF